MKKGRRRGDGSDTDGRLTLLAEYQYSYLDSGIVLQYRLLRVPDDTLLSTPTVTEETNANLKTVSDKVVCTSRECDAMSGGWSTPIVMH